MSMPKLLRFETEDHTVLLAIHIFNPQVPLFPSQRALLTGTYFRPAEEAGFGLCCWLHVTIVNQGMVILAQCKNKRDSK